jgi:hypothetical protein
MDISENIVIGIITGILTSAFIALFVAVCQKIIMPWYLELIYNGLNIDGEWATSFIIEGVEEEAILIIDQRATKLGATMTISTCRPDGETSVKTYRLHGRFENRFVVLSGKNINKQQLGVNVMLLQVSDGGNKLVGSEVWFSTVHNRIQSATMEWKRRS